MVASAQGSVVLFASLPAIKGGLAQLKRGVRITSVFMN
jgi:hypothetical protein